MRLPARERLSPAAQSRASPRPSCPSPSSECPTSRPNRITKTMVVMGVRIGARPQRRSAPPRSTASPCDVAGAQGTMGSMMYSMSRVRRSSAAVKPDAIQWSRVPAINATTTRDHAQEQQRSPPHTRVQLLRFLRCRRFANLHQNRQETPGVMAPARTSPTNEGIRNAIRYASS